jgi:hypothetical protein
VGLAAVAAEPGAAPTPAPPPVTLLLARDLGGARPQTTALALAAAEGGELRMAVAALPVPGSGASSALLVAELDGRGLLRASESDTVSLEITTYALTAGGQVAAFLADGVRITGARELGEHGVRYLAPLALAAGGYELRVFVRERSSGAFALRTARLVVPATPRPPVAFVPASDEGWVEVHSHRLPAAGGDPALAALAIARPGALPLVASAGGGNLRWVGSARPPSELVLRRPGDGAPVARVVPLAVADEVAANPGPGPEVAADDVGREAPPRPEVALAPAASAAPGEPAAATASAATATAAELHPAPTPEETLAAPAATALLPALDVPTAVYSLSVRWAEVPGEDAASTPLGVMAGRAEHLPSAWPALIGPRVAPPRPPPPPSAGIAGRRNEQALRSARGQLVAAYRSALGQFAGGDREAALDTLDAAEGAVAAADPRTGTLIIQEVAQGEIERLARLDRQALLAVAELHQRQFFATLASRRPGTGLLGFETARFALDRYAAGADPAERRLVAAFHLAVAGQLLAIGSEEHAAELAAAAERLVPNHPPAMLLQAFVAERSGRRREAAALLDRLLARVAESDPAHAEARLRRAVLATRLGERQAESRLLALLAPTHPRWVRVVALQELARWLVAEQRTARALELFAADPALAAEPTLAVTQAWVLERAGRRREARSVLLTNPTPSATESPRHRYGRWSDVVLRADRQRAEEAVLLNLGRLAQALTRLPAVVG